MASPIAGFRPILAARFRTWRMPRPVRLILSPLLRCRGERHQVAQHGLSLLLDGQAAVWIARQFLPPHVQKDTLPLLSVRNTILHCCGNGTVDWQTKRPERCMSKPHPNSRLHVLRFCMRLCTLTVAVMASWPFPVDADTGRPLPLVVIMPPVRPPSPPELAVPAQPALQWAPPPAMGLTPGLRSPTALCYAGADVCPLTQPEHIGKPCTWGTGGPLLGRTLIPPSHDISGPLRHTN
jgi:hypothetical protein